MEKLLGSERPRSPSHVSWGLGKLSQEPLRGGLDKGVEKSVSGSGKLASVYQVTGLENFPCGSREPTSADHVTWDIFSGSQEPTSANHVTCPSRGGRGRNSPWAWYSPADRGAGSFLARGAWFPAASLSFLKIFVQSDMENFSRVWAGIGRAQALYALCKTLTREGG